MQRTTEEQENETEYIKLVETWQDFDSTQRATLFFFLPYHTASIRL